MTAGERTGWRDLDLSRRHRRWGFNCPGVDLDFVLVEYHLALPVAIVEYKHHRAGNRFDFGHPTYQAVGTLADRAAIPFVVARYWPSIWAFHVIGVNARSQALLGADRSFSEAEYVGWLHSLRSLVVEEVVLRHLNDERPPRRPAA